MSGMPDTYRHSTPQPEEKLSPEDDVPLWTGLEVRISRRTRETNRSLTHAPVASLVNQIKQQCNGSFGALIISPVVTTREDDDESASFVEIHLDPQNPESAEARRVVNERLRDAIHHHAAEPKNGKYLTVLYRNGEETEKTYPPPPWKPPHYTLKEHLHTLWRDLLKSPRVFWRWLLDDGY